MRHEGENLPYKGEEQVDVINLWHLIHEGRDIVYEFLKIAVHNDIQINSVFSACKESLPIASSIRKEIYQYIVSCCTGKYFTRPDPASRLPLQGASG